jgi:hypothetical protein
MPTTIPNSTAAVIERQRVMNHCIASSPEIGSAMLQAITAEYGDIGGFQDCRGQ